MKNDLKKNGSGYYDPTAYHAMRNSIDGGANMEVFRGDIFYLTGSGGKRIGSEQDQNRPCVIVSNDTGNKHSTVVEIVYLSAASKNPLPTHCTIMCKIPSVALCEQIDSVSKARLGEWIRKCTDEEMAAIDKCLWISLGIVSDAHEDVAIESVNKLKEQLMKYMESLESEQMITDSLKKELAEVANERDEAKKERDILRKEWQEMRAAMESGKNEDLIKITAQRDLYKALYDQIIERTIGR